MNKILKSLLIAILLFGLSLKGGLTQEIIFHDDLIKSSTKEEYFEIQKITNQYRVDPYFSQSNIIFNLAIRDCNKYLNYSELYRDLCYCAGWETAILGKYPSPIKDHGECHYKLMLAGGILYCGAYYIPRPYQQKRIFRLYDLILDDVDAGICSVQ